jgi:FtsP/CotA-like multicopper oxidase with cupredoxin domain
MYIIHFLINGKQTIEYPDFKPEKVRVRVINGGASTSWMTLGEDPVLVSSDGHDVVPVVKKQDIYGVSETYDFIVTIPEDDKIEYRLWHRMVQVRLRLLGSGKILAAVVPRPDKIGMMQRWRRWI